MTLTADVLTRWEPQALLGAGSDLRTCSDQVAEVADQVQRATGAMAWESVAGEAARASGERLTVALRAVAASLALQADVLLRARGALEAAQDLLARARAVAAEHGLHVLPDGAVTPPHPVLTPADPAPDVVQAIEAQQRSAREAQRRAEALAREALAAADECDADAARALALGDSVGALLAGVAAHACSVLGAGLPSLALRSLLRDGLLAEVDGRAVPARGADPHRVAAWWGSLPPDVQAELARDRPVLLGGLDGLPAAVRDRANRARLDAERQALLDEVARLERRLDDNLLGGTFTNDDAALEHARGKLEALDAVEAVLRQPGRQLLVLDLTGELAMAAVSAGDVDTAAHVAVFTPGLTTTVQGSLAKYDRQLAALRVQSELMADRAGGGSVATVAWLGYEAPQWDGLLSPSRSVALDGAATRGAERLSGFYAGLDAARSESPHLTALGHSYGSLTTGLALGRGTAVDDVVFFGSPGIGTSDVADLGLPAGRVHVVEARQDVVADLARFGDDPNQLDGVITLSAQATEVDGRQLAESVGHSSYLSDGSTSQYAMAAVVSGQADQAPRDDGRGIGDWLQTPPPSWLRTSP